MDSSNLSTTTGSVASRGDFASIFTGSPYATVMVAYGLGIMNLSQLFKYQALLAWAARGSMGAPDLCAAMRAPGAYLYAGPRGPSGVIATSPPSLSTRTKPSRARSAPRLLEPRTVLQ